MKSPVVDTKVVSNGYATVRVRMRQNGEIVIDEPGNRTGRVKPWVCSQLYLKNKLRVVLR